MAIKWSWAFGPETGVELEEMGWTIDDAAYVAPSTAYTYTYTGSPTRYSLAIDDDYSETNIPVGCTPLEGWAAMPVYASGSYDQGNTLMKITAADGYYISIHMKNAVSNTFALWVRNVEKATWTMPLNDWNYVALQYSITGSTWSGRAYVDGAAVTSEFTNAGAASATAQLTVKGVASSTRSTYLGQIVTFDSKADAGHTPRYCTRIEPTVDTSTVGVWTPNVGTHDFAVLSGSFDASTFTENSGSTIGDNCRVEAQNLATQLGVSPTSIAGITVHAWATGSGQNGFAAISDNNSNYDNGAAITPDTNDPTYAFSTAPDKPSDAAGWSATSSVYFKYEVS